MRLSGISAEYQSEANKVDFAAAAILGLSINKWATHIWDKGQLMLTVTQSKNCSESKANIQLINLSG